MKNENGITLIALIIIIVVMLIIASVSIYNGTDSVNKTRLNGFYTQLEIVQERVDDVSSTNESYIDENNVIYIKEAGQNLTEDQKNKLQNILVSKEIAYADIIDNFRYFTIQDIKNILDLEEIDYNLFINFDNRIIVAEEGITIDDTTYYMLENTKYFVESNPSKNVGEDGKIKRLKYSDPIQYGEGRYKINIEPEDTIGDLDKSGYIKYKKATSNYWEITNENYIIIEFDIEYDIVYTDLNNNSIERTIKIEYEKDGDGNFVQDEEGNNIVTVTEVAIEESEEI